MQLKTKLTENATKFIVHIGFPLLALVIIFITLPSWEPRERWGLLLTFTILTLVCTFAPVKSLRAVLTLNNAVILSGILLEGTWIAVWSGVIEILILSFLFKSTLTRALANAGQMLVTIWIVGNLYELFERWAVPWVISDMLLIPVYWAINLSLVAIIVSYYVKVSWIDTIKNMVKVGTATYMMLMVLGAIGGRFVDIYGYPALIPLGIAFIATRTVFRQYFNSHNQLEQKVEEIKSLNHSFLTAFAASIDARDPYTSGHSQRVAYWGREIATAIDLPKEKIDEVYFGGILHDVGKIGIEDEILNKEGKLSPEEFNKIKQHTVIGYEIVKQAGVFEELLPAVRYHHERIDGRGYPDGLHGEEIPLVARILAIADAFDAMVSDRPYRRGLPIDVALQQIEDGAGTQFDNNLAITFIRLVKAIPDDELLQIIGQGSIKKQSKQYQEAIY